MKTTKEYRKKVSRIKHAREVRQDRAFEKGISALRAYFADSGSSDVPVMHFQKMEDGNYPLGHWVSNQRAKFRRGAMSREIVRLLESFRGWTWCAWDKGWVDAMEALQVFRAREGHPRVPLKHIENGFELGAWVARQRSRYKLDTKRREELDAWNYRDANNIPQPLVKSKTDENEMVSMPKPRVILSLPTRRELEKIPQWSEDWKDVESERLWLLKVSLLRRFAAKHGHTDVPRGFQDKGVSLGIWVNSIRSQYNRKCISGARIKDVESVPGWKWARPRHEVKQAGFDSFDRFVSQFGHGRVPRNYVDDKGFRLGDWVGKKRSAHKKGTLNQRDVLRLEQVSAWSWSAKQAKAK